MSQVLFALFWIASLAGWITHLVRCISEDYAAFLIAGIFIPPIGVLHGWYVWFFV